MGDADAGVGDGELEVGDVALDVAEGEACGDGAALGEFEGVAEEIGDDLPEACGVADEGLGNVGGDIEGESEFFGLGVEAHGLDEGLEFGARGEGDGFEGEFTGFEFGRVEDVVEEAEEVKGAFMGDFGVVAIVGGKGAFAEEVEEADDAAEWGADLVAHDGEELAFGLGGGFGGFFGGEGGLFGVFAVGDVGAEGDEAGDVAGAFVKRVGGEQPGAGAAIGAGVVGLGGGRVALPGAFEGLGDGGFGGGGPEIEEGAADELGGIGVAEGGEAVAVDSEKGAVAIEHLDAIGGALDEAAVELFGDGEAFETVADALLHAAEGEQEHGEEEGDEEDREAGVAEVAVPVGGGDIEVEVDAASVWEA
ncbi:MAG: hypothetical protein BWX86_00421 [Verrucomicrobia bacterium ADurb.Bin122]|nr:MAG: hypothetical protein BWX86_00421 [Verrucomicrobia bacterium ADurb.Bin122]